ncbi:MAG: hypothetical protein NZ750_03560 [Anaerolineae bacterium]|nr:hypothetical protein [Anaerolineae bacterium]MDW8171398.1 hypothetical protein [Anaerolineae bacterium]
MKRLSWLILALLCCGLAYAQDAPDLRQQAIDRYEQAVAQGVRNARALAQLGRLYAQAEDWPRAALRFAQALAYAPRDASISAALLEAQQRSGALVAPQSDPWLSMVEAMQSMLSREESLWLAVALWWTVWLLASAIRLRSAWRSWLYPTLVSLILLTSFYFSLLSLRLWAETQRPQVMLVRPSAGYTGPGEDFLALGDFPPATLAHQIEVRDGWARVQWSDGGQAWVRSEALALIALP